MLASNQPELRVIAAQLIEILDTYQRTVGALIASRRDMALYSDSSEQFDRGRLYASSLPRVQVVWIDLLICRYELMTALWSEQLVARREIVRLQERHEAALLAVRRTTIRHYLQAAPAGPGEDASSALGTRGGDEAEQPPAG